MTTEITVSNWCVSYAQQRGCEVRWKPLVANHNGFLGVDSTGEWYSSSRGGTLITPLNAENALYAIPVLDLTISDLSLGLSLADPSLRENASRTLVTLIACAINEALRQRAETYVDVGLRWVELVPRSAALRDALADLVASKRGTQRQRQLARRLLRDY
jgi:hypothetical protein